MKSFSDFKGSQKKENPKTKQKTGRLVEESLKRRGSQRVFEIKRNNIVRNIYDKKKHSLKNISMSRSGNKTLSYKAIDSKCVDSEDLYPEKLINSNEVQEYTNEGLKNAKKTLGMFEYLEYKRKYWEWREKAITEDAEEYDKKYHKAYMHKKREKVKAYRQRYLEKQKSAA